MTAPFYNRLLAAAVIVVSVPTFASLSIAEGTHGGGHGGSDIGKAGNASAVTRTVDIQLLDNYYEPEVINVKKGETIRFVVVNNGELVHEFAIATPEMHHAHQGEMQMMADHGVLEAFRINMEAAKAMQASMGHGMHDEPNSVLLEPGKSGEVIWTFPASGKLEFACNVPGHYEAGMVGDIILD